MIHRIKGTIHFECDTCREGLDTETHDFEEAREKLKAEGWRTDKDGDLWTHKCKECAGG